LEVEDVRFLKMRQESSSLFVRGMDVSYSVPLIDRIDALVMDLIPSRRAE
jgi:hypothetical protein